MAKKAAPKKPAGDNALGLVGSYVGRIEKLEIEKSALAGDIKDIYNEAEAAGLDKKVMRGLVSRRKKDAAELAELERLINLYDAAMKKSAEE